MKVVLNNGTELDVISINGAKTVYQNVTRDSLEFIIPTEGNSLENLLTLFSDKEAVSTITIQNDESESFVYQNYCILESASAQNFVVAGETSESPEVNELRFVVKMVQKSHIECSLDNTIPRITSLEEQIAQLQEQVTTNTEAIAELKTPDVSEQ